MAIITEADLATIEPKLINKVRMTEEYGTLATQVFTTRPLPKGKGRTANFPKYGTFEAFDADEGIEVDNPQSLGLTNVAVVPTEIVAQFLLTDTAVRTNSENVAEDAGEILGNAMRRKVDKRGLAMFDTYTNSLGGDAVQAATNYISAAATILEGGTEMAPHPYNLVLRPEPLRRLLDQLTPVGTYPIPEGISAQVANEYLAKNYNFFGADAGFKSGNIDRVAAAVDANRPSSGALFSKKATLYVPATELDVEKDRRMKARGWLYQASHTFGFVHLEPSWGVKLRFISATPTS